MKLNYDCVRNLLLALEEYILYTDTENGCATESVRLNKLAQNSNLQEYKIEEIVYTSEKLEEAGFIECDIADACGGIIDIVYYSVTFCGHQYLDTIRSQPIWDGVKSTIKTKGLSFSFDIIKTVIPHVLNSLLSK